MPATRKDLRLIWVLGNEYMSIHDILTEFRGKNVQTGTCSKEAYVPID